MIDPAEIGARGDIKNGLIRDPGQTARPNAIERAIRHSRSRI